MTDKVCSNYRNEDKMMRDYSNK